MRTASSRMLSRVTAPHEVQMFSVPVQKKIPLTWHAWQFMMVSRDIERGEGGRGGAGEKKGNGTFEMNNLTL